jgi:hypothetical protein
MSLHMRLLLCWPLGGLHAWASRHGGSNMLQVHTASIACAHLW